MNKFIELENLTEPELTSFMNGLAATVEMTCRKRGLDQPYFTLILWNDPRLAQYVGNCGNRKSMIEALREMADRLERREDFQR